MRRAAGHSGCLVLLLTVGVQLAYLNGKPGVLGFFGSSRCFVAPRADRWPKAPTVSTTSGESGESGDAAAAAAVLLKSKPSLGAPLLQEKSAAQAQGHWAGAVFAIAAGSVAACALRARGRLGSRISISGGRCATAAAAGGGAEAEWKPRNSGWTDAELAAKRTQVEGLSDPDSSYSGPHYAGPQSVNPAFINDLLNFYKQDGRLAEKYAFRMVLDIIDILGKEPTLRPMAIPEGQDFKVVGDLHGQYWDFLTVVGLVGLPSAANPVIFNGDFVDRGSWSIEVLMVVFAMKLMAPAAVGLNRGNHEMLEANIIYGFCGECGAKYNMELFDLFSEAFRRLPLAHLVDEKVLVVHAGLPGPRPRIWMPGQTHDPTDAIPMMCEPPALAELAAVDRMFEIGPDQYKDSIGPDTEDKTVNDERITIDLLWSDPRGGDGFGPSYRKAKGVYMFGPDVTKAFCEKNGLQCVVRSHEVKADGYRWDHPQLCTVFSAPNYLDTGNNKGAILRLSRSSDGSVAIEPVSFVAAKHPDLPPMHWQSVVVERHPYLLRKMKKKGVAETFDEFGDSDFAGMGLMNFDEWEPDEADQFQEAFKVDEYGRDLE